MNPLLIGALAGGILFGSLTVARFERDAAQEIRKTLQGPNAKVKVRARVGLESIAGTVPSITIEASDFITDGLPFHTEPWRSKQGHLDRLQLDMRDFTLTGLRVSSLDALIPDCRFDLALAASHHRFRLSRSGTGPVTVRIRDADFEPFILGKFPEIKSVQVRIGRGRVVVSGFALLAILATQFKVDAQLTVRNGAQLVLQDATVELGGKPADPKLASALLTLFDPLIDLNKDMHLENAVSVETVELEDSFLVGRGTVTIPDATGPARPSVADLSAGVPRPPASTSR